MAAGTAVVVKALRVGGAEDALGRARGGFAHEGVGAGRVDAASALHAPAVFDTAHTLLAAQIEAVPILGAAPLAVPGHRARLPPLAVRAGRALWPAQCLA